MDPARGDPSYARRLRPGRKDPLLRAVQLHRLAAHQGRAPRPGARRRRTGHAAAAVQPAGPRDRVGDHPGGSGCWASACCRGARSAAAGCRASTGATSGRPATPDSATIRSEAWRRTTDAAPTPTWRVIDAVQSVAEARGVSMAQVALAWLHDRPSVTSVILGARTTEQLGANLDASGLHLDSDETAVLDEASAPTVGDYPYGELGVDQRSRDLAGPASSERRNGPAPPPRCRAVRRQECHAHLSVTADRESSTRCIGDPPGRVALASELVGVPRIRGPRRWSGRRMHQRPPPRAGR